MTIERQVTTKLEKTPELAIDVLLAKFHSNVDRMVDDPNSQYELAEALNQFNPLYVPFGEVGKFEKIDVLTNIVSGVYAPFIHGFSLTILKNIKNGSLPQNLLTPPRDAIPIATSIEALAKDAGINISILMPFLNRNTAGIANNQRSDFVGKSPLLDLHLHQVVASLNGKNEVVELETGIYGTTSLEAARLLKQNGITKYVPIKLYGLGPNISWVHAMLSDGKEWIAEKAEDRNMVDLALINSFMVILDTMEELGMEKWYKSVESLQLSAEGIVEPVVDLSTPDEFEIAVATNQVLKTTAPLYKDLNVGFIKSLIERIPSLTLQAQKGLPVSLVHAIPSMDSKEEHYNTIRQSNLFDYPNLII